MKSDTKFVLGSIDEVSKMVMEDLLNRAAFVSS